MKFKQHLEESARPKANTIVKKRDWYVHLEGQRKMKISARTPADAMKSAMKRAGMSPKKDMDKVNGVMLAEEHQEDLNQ